MQPMGARDQEEAQSAEQRNLKNLNEWIVGIVFFFGCCISRCIITKEANNDDNRFRGGILKDGAAKEKANERKK